MHLNSVVYCLNSPANDYDSITSDSTNEASLLYKYGISLKEDSLLMMVGGGIPTYAAGPVLLPFFFLLFVIFFFFFFSFFPCVP